MSLPAFAGSVIAPIVGWAEARPSRSALVDGHQSLSYGALLMQAQESAARLAGSPGKRVALLSDHDAFAVTGLIAGMLAGKTVIPLDPTHPPARLAWMLADAEADSLLASPRHQGLARALATGTPRLVTPGDAPTHLLGPLDPESVAYLLYTSGSTGQPKGVEQSHQNLLHHIETYGKSLDLTEEDRLTLLPSTAVDAGLMDIFGALVHGASLHLWDLRTRGVDGLATWLTRSGVTILHTTPSVFRAFAATLKPQDTFPTIRRLVLGGEPARLADLALFQRHFRGATQLVNGYGPTECTLGLQAFFGVDTPVREDPLPLGQPVASCEVLLLDEGGAPADEGEIALQSLFLALGYWNRPALNTAVFLPDPEGGKRRIYRTGDRGRRRADGHVTFEGRRDDQVKLRGHRIELGEIEAQMRAFPQVREAVVQLETGPLDEPMLTAHVCANVGDMLSISTLLAWLRERLPAPWVPSRLRVHADFPRTSSGKVDRRSLGSALDAVLPAKVERELTPTETWLSALFRTLLRDPSPAPASDFFALGGHSLLATRLLANIEAHLGRAFTPALIFEHPTLAALASALDHAMEIAPGRATESAPDRATESATDGHEARPLGPILRVDRSAPHPLSPAQARLWFFERLMPGCPVYHVPLVTRLQGSLNRDALCGALAVLLRRHEALRTRVGHDEKGPVQRIDPPSLPTLTELGGGALSAPTTLEQARSLCTVFACRPFDLEEGPLLRAALVRLDDKDHLFVLTLHHFVADGWSARLLIQELFADYQALAAGLSSPLPTPSLQYLDACGWLSKALSEARIATLLRFWTDALQGANALDLPLDRLRPALPSFRGHTRNFTLGDGLTADLRALAVREGATLSMIFLAAFALLLSRMAGQEDIVIGTATQGRGRIELEALAGTFVNTLLLRLDLGAPRTLRALLTQARDVTARALAHQDLPIDRLVAALHPERAAGQTPLFQAMLLVDDLARPSVAMPELLATPVEIERGTALTDITLNVRDEGTLRLSLEAASDLFDASTIARMEGHLRTLLDGFVATPNPSLSSLAWLTPNEQQTLHRWSQGTTSLVDFETPLAHVIEAQSARTPDTLALVHGPHALSYRALLSKAHEVAVRLRAEGIARGALVSMRATRDLDLVPTWLGILLVGAAFIPLDPQGEGTDDLDGASSGLRFLGPISPLVRDASGAEAPVYGFYTSGSTGTPKLALIPQRGLKNRFAWMDETFGATPPITLATTDPFFDSAVWQLLWPLTRGGTVIFPAENPVLSARVLSGLVARHKVTLLDFVPSVFDAMGDGLVTTELTSVKDIILGGEALHERPAQRVSRTFPGARVFNLYGPTEASIGCIAHPITPDSGHEIPLGRAIPNVTTLLLDAQRRPVPVGVCGELYLGGACVGLGYAGDPAATERAFVDLHAPELAATKHYRTGDKARWREDGTLYFVGRVDAQIKIRGHRIEPSAIELVLEQHPSVIEAAVLRKDTTSGEPVLVACVAPASATGDLQAFLRARLPAPMVPSRFVALDALPRNPSGKIDRRALERLPLDAPAPLVKAFPQSDLERTIAALWGDLLGLAVVDIDAGFFDLGGHSLRLAMLAQRLERTLQREIPLIELFRRPTVRSMASWLAGEDAPTPALDLSLRAAAIRRQRARRRG